LAFSLIQTPAIALQTMHAPSKRKRSPERATPKAFKHEQYMPEGVRTIIARDPGESPGTACLWLQGAPIARRFGPFRYDIPPLFWVGNDPTWVAAACEHGLAIAVTEGQWLKGNAKRRKAILTLSLRAGIWLGRTCERHGLQGYVLPVDVWKSKIFDGAQMDKYVHCNRIEQLLTPQERAGLPVTGKHDALSAIGIAFAAYLIGDISAHREI